MKRRRVPVREYQAYVDETSKGGVTYAVALLFEEHAARRLDARWHQLRVDLRSIMERKDYPLAKNFLEDPSFLPEIHAAHLYGSSGFFRFDDCDDSDYWKVHRKIIDEAVNIIARSKPIMLMGSSRNDISKNQLMPSSDIAAKLKYKNMKAKMDRLYRSPYVTALNILITTLEEFSSKHGVEISLNCDNHDDGKGFSVLETFQIARKLYPQFKVNPPSFHDSASSNLLQAVDVFAYIFAVSYTDFKELNYLPKKDTSKWQMILSQFISLEKVEINPLIQQRMVSRMLELLITQSGGPLEYQGLIRESVSDMLRRILEGDSKSGHIQLDNEGLRFFEQAEMYKPPSEDGDLSE